MDNHVGLPSRAYLGRLAMGVLATVALGVQTGCTREFFREWANQDVSEAIFEKSRDPRWRLDIFSVDPPSLSRFADPYDPDVPPAPPDDYASEALSPVPQWPDNRLLVPVEGTGYLDLMESWRTNTTRMEPEGPASRDPGAPVSNSGIPGMEPATAPPPATGAPFATPPSPATPPGGAAPGALTPPGEAAPGRATGPETAPPPPLPNPPGAVPTPMSLRRPNPGTARVALSPSRITGTPPSNPPAAATGRTLAQSRTRDTGVRRTAMQQPQPDTPTTPAPIPPGAPSAARPVAPPDTGDPTIAPPGGPERGQTGGPDNSLRDLRQPVGPRPDLRAEDYKASESKMAELSGLIMISDTKFNVNEESGLRREDTPYVLTVDHAFRLALINSRVYQFNLENIYLQALPVTLQRFQFQPNFYAGMSPITAPLSQGSSGAFGSVGGGFPGLNPANRFTYSTRATGVPASGLSIGTVAGVGKAFSAGGKLVMGFANQVVFNFLGPHSRQPSVQSQLPLSFVQPFLAGGGRAVTLEALTQAERNLLYQIRSFALFRQQFTVAILVGGSIQNFGSQVSSLGFTGGGNNDPTTGYVNVLEDLQIVENNRRNVATFARLFTIYKELMEGESSGLTQLQVDQIGQNLQTARNNYLTSRLTYRNDLDNFKMQMGMPPDTIIVPDRGLTKPFKDVFDGIDRWGADRNRKLEDLPDFADRLPALQDVVLDGRSVLKVAELEKEAYDGSYFYEQDLEDLLRAGERLGLEHRLDLMNTRAQLYDAWRQIRFQANSLKGVFDIQITNQFVTPTTTTNPFGFVDQAKQFSLVMNAELPLIRVSQRNNFRTALIDYQRQRRTLQNNEDSIKNLIRQDIRNVIIQYLQYEIAKRNFILFARLKDQAFEQIVAPAAAGAAGNVANAAVQTQNLTQSQNQLINQENGLITTWLNYQIARLALYRDLGTLPYDEWEAYRELFPAGSTGGSELARRGEGPSRLTASNPPQDVRRR